MRINPSIVIVTRTTRLEGLRKRWGTAGQAEFRLKTAQAVDSTILTTFAAGNSSASSKGKKRQKPAIKARPQANFEEYVSEDRIYQDEVAMLERELQFGFPVKVIDRSFVPNYNFFGCVAVVVVGQDGLVANVAKYVSDTPIVAVNPDPTRIDGLLLPFRTAQAVKAVRQVLDGRFPSIQVTMIDAKLNDGQSMLAFNDLFIGCSSHVSARYVLEAGGKSEAQSSSGMLVSTGVGSTGWLSSVFNMTCGMAKFLGSQVPLPKPIPWDAKELIWTVREPFKSRTSKIGLIAGRIQGDEKIVIESLMPENGVVFSDGIEADFLPFTSGSILSIEVSKQRAILVLPVVPELRHGNAHSGSSATLTLNSTDTRHQSSEST